MEQKFDVVVIGTGPGGEGAAMQAAKGGKSVAVVESYSRIGGGCTHWGTIPSKALRFSIYSVMEAMNNPIVKEMGLRVNPTLSQLRASSKSIIAKQEAMRQNFYDRNNVPVIHGRAQFIDAHTLAIDEETRLVGEHIVIATGSRPYHPANVDFDHPLIFDSDTILELTSKPQSITIYGAGVIGCEYASMFRNLGIKVNLVNTRSKLLEFLDDEIIDALAYHMRDSGVLIRHNETMSKIEGHEDGVVLYLESGKQVKTDIFLWANGRSGNTDGLGLEKIGVTPDSRGIISVNENFQTQCPNVYAVGDVIGFPSLASAAYMQGRAAAQHLEGGFHSCLRMTDIPNGIYTSPEISSIGKSERELTPRRSVRSGTLPVQESGSSSNHRSRDRDAKDPVPSRNARDSRGPLLRPECFEIIHIGQAIMKQPAGHNTWITSSIRPSITQPWRKPIALLHSMALIASFEWRFQVAKSSRDDSKPMEEEKDEPGGR